MLTLKIDNDGDKEVLIYKDKRGSIYRGSYVNAPANIKAAYEQIMTLTREVRDSEERSFTMTIRRGTVTWFGLSRAYVFFSLLLLSIMFLLLATINFKADHKQDPTSIPVRRSNADQQQ